MESFGSGEPIAADIDASDEDVAEYLEEVLQSARTLPESPAMRGRLAMAYEVNGFRDAALRTYDQAETLDPSDFRWPYFSAQLEAETGDYETALETLQRALAIDANYGPAWLWRGTWLLEAGRVDEAMVAFDRAEALNVGPAAAFGRARVMIARGQPRQALDLLEPLAATTNHPFIYRTLGETLRAEGRIDEAREAMARGKDPLPISWLDERLDEKRAHVRGYASYELAIDLSAGGQEEKALDIFARLQRHIPEARCGEDEDFFLACNLMNSSAIAYDRSGYPERALETVRRGLALNEKFIPFHLTIANLYRHQGELETALVHVDRAIELNPARGYAHQRRGRLLFGLERYAEAEGAFENSLRYEPEQQTTLFYLGLTLVELGDWNEALSRFERVVQLEPGFALGHTFRARMLAELGRLEEARSAQDEAERYGADPAALRATEIRLRELEAQG
jgi:tetratricopeptide (TPR) repeat protein